MLLSHFIKSPRTIGSLIPSSPTLSTAMAADLQNYPLIIEIGAGTGAITNHLHQYPQAKILVFEFNASLCTRLSQKLNLPNAHFYHGPVHQHAELLLKATRKSPCAIISSLPFKSLPAHIATPTEQLLKLLLQTHPLNLLRQFSYTTPLRSKPPTPHIPWNPTKLILHNIPPATIWEAHPSPR